METIGSGSSLPLVAQIPTSVVLVFVLLAALRIAPGTSARFVVFACWLRFMISAFHIYTYRELFGGLSGSAVGSAMLFLIGVLLLPRRLLLSTAIFGAYAVLGAVGLSALANAAIADAIDPMVKFGLFTTIALHSYNALRSGEERRFAMGVMLAFAPLLVFQALSLVLGISKGSSADEIRNFIGGYEHEAAFSVALSALLVIAAVNRRIPPGWKACGISLAIAGIFFANYRTAIIAVAPLLLYYLLKGIGRLFDARLRPLVIAVAGAALMTSGTTYLLSSDRFADLRTIAESEQPLVKHPQQFNQTEMALLSGRVYLWSSYFYVWKEQGNQVQRLVGFGPDSWPRYFKTYAHNTFVSFLFEYGIVGTAALVFLIAAGFVLALKGGQERWRLVAAHLSFVILNMATMPMWMVEGLILYGLLWGHTMYYRAVPRSVAQVPSGKPLLRPVPA